MEDVTLVKDIDIGRALAASANRAGGAQGVPKARRQALVMIEQEPLVAPLASYRLLPVCEVSGGTIHLTGGATLHAPVLSELSAQLEGITAVACTLGPALERRVSALCADRQLSLALALDELGNELLMYTLRLVGLKIRRLVRHRGLSAGGALIPGEALPFDQQEKVVAMAGGMRIGITVRDKGSLLPVKSRALIIGVGEGIPAEPNRRRCEQCSSKEQCRYRGR